MSSHSSPRWSRHLGPLLAAAALLPTAATVLQATTVTESYAARRAKSAREKVLEKLPTDDTVLINASYRDVPASPDILELGKRTTKALERGLADNVDANVRARCAVTLHALGDRRALDTLRTALADWDADVRYLVVRALGAMPDEKSVEPLIQLYRRQDETDRVRRAILKTLGKTSSQKVVRFLRDELRKDPDEDETDLRPSVFDALWNVRHLTGRVTLVGDTRSALQSDNDALVLSATYAAAELRSKRLVSALIPLMEHKWENVRNRAVYALGHVGDQKATKALLERLPKVRESRMLNNIAFALERLDKDAFYASMEDIATHKQAVIRLNAAYVLGDVAHGKGLPLLKKSLADPSDYVRTSAVVAVGKLGTTDGSQREAALAALKPFLDDPNLTIRAEAIYASHELTEGGRTDLIHDKLFTLDRRKHRGVVQRAAFELARAGDPRALDDVLRCVTQQWCGAGEFDDYLVAQMRPAVSSQLLVAWTRGRGYLTSLVARTGPDGAVTVGRGALEQAWSSPGSFQTRVSLDLLGALGDDAVLPLVQRRANTRSLWPRLYAHVAATRLGDADAANEVVAELKDLPAEWLPRAAWAVSKADEAKDSLGPELAKLEKDPHVDLALAAAFARLQWNPDQAFFRFLEGLSSKSPYERDLAERYLDRDDRERVTWLLRRALAREGRADVADRLRAILDARA